MIEAAMQVQTGAADVVLAGGAESMSQAELYSTTLRWGARSGGAMLEDRLVRGRVTAGGENYPVPGGMIETAENLRREYQIPREEQDELALRSHQKVVMPQRCKPPCSKWRRRREDGSSSKRCVVLWRRRRALPTKLPSSAVLSPRQSITWVMRQRDR